MSSTAASTEAATSGQVGVKVRNYQEAVVLRMPDGEEVAFLWMDVE